jgi:hypothetical protein
LLLLLLLRQAALIAAECKMLRARVLALSNLSFRSLLSL